MSLAQSVSREARARNRPQAPAQRTAILAFIRSRGVDGATCDEVEVALGMSHQTCSARFTDLKIARHIETLGELRPTRTGSPAIAWVVPS